MQTVRIPLVIALFAACAACASPVRVAARRPASAACTADQDAKLKDLDAAIDAAKAKPDGEPLSVATITLAVFAQQYDRVLLEGVKYAIAKNDTGLRDVAVSDIGCLVDHVVTRVPDFAARVDSEANRRDIDGCADSQTKAGLERHPAKTEAEYRKRYESFYEGNYRWCSAHVMATAAMSAGALASLKN